MTKKVQFRKSFCDKECNNCKSFFYINSAKRFCYDEKYNLVQTTGQLKYKRFNKVTVVLTGLVDTLLSGIDYSSESFSLGAPEIMKIKTYNKDKYRHILREVCKELGISYRKFINKVKKVTYEVEDDE